VSANFLILSRSAGSRQRRVGSLENCTLLLLHLSLHRTLAGVVRCGIVKRGHYLNKCWMLAISHMTTPRRELNDSSSIAKGI
jgi:hypothetical protein